MWMRIVRVTWVFVAMMVGTFSDMPVCAWSVF